MTDGAWSLLGLEATADEAAIRRAYARRLKLTRPDEDPEGFQALLAARERAMSEARRRPAPAIPDDLEPASESDAPGEVCPPNAANGGTLVAKGQKRPAPLIRDAAPAESGRSGALDPAMVRDVGTQPPLAKTPDAQLFPPPPPPHVIDVAPLEAGPAEWDAARTLADAVPPLERTGTPAFAAWLAEVRRLPHGPRVTAEAALLRVMFAAWRGPDGRLTARYVAATHEAVMQAAPVFGWPREDAVLAMNFSPQDAALASQVLRDLLPPEPGDPAVAMVPVGPRGRLPLHAADARAFLETAPHALKAYESMRRREPVARWVPVFALLAPHLWAIAHRRWGVALAGIAGLWCSFLLAQVAVAKTGAMAAALGTSAVLVWVTTALATALDADRILVAGAARAARRAGRKGIYAPGERRALLSHAGQRLGFWGWALIAWWGAIVLFAPYLGPINLAGYALGLDPVQP